MADTITAPIPAGVQSTFDKPLGPQSSKGEHAQKFRKAFAELTREDVKPVEQATPAQKPSEPEPAPAAKEEPKVEPKVEPVTTDKKPESPLDAVLSKATTKEPEKIEEPDVLKEFDEKTANWQRAREVMKTQSGELKTLREKVKSLETAPKAEPSVIEELTRQRDELQAKYQEQEQRIKGVSAEYSEEFQGMLAQREGIIGKISSRVKAYGGDAQGLIEALALPEGKIKTAQIKEALAEVDPDDKPRIHALIEQLDTHDEKIADFRKDLPKKWDEISAKRDAELAEHSQAAIKQLEAEFGKVAESIPANINTLRTVAEDVPGASEWNSEIKQAIENGLKVLTPNGADFKTSAEIAIKGSRYDSLEKRYLSLHSDYSELKQKYNEAVGSGPDFKGGNKPAPKADAGKYKRGSYAENLAAIRAAETGQI